MAKNKKGNSKISLTQSPTKNNKNKNKSINNNSSSPNNSQNNTITPNIINPQEQSISEPGSSSHTISSENVIPAFAIQPFDLQHEMETISEEIVDEEEDWDQETQSPPRESSSSVSDKVTLKLDIEDVQSEIEYWSNAIYCYVLGANPPGYVLGGFVRRAWRFHDIDTVSTLANGICVVRFKDVASKQTVLRSGPIFFDNKPLVVKDWTPDTKMVKSELEIVPIWIRFYGLDLKFWGLALNKIASLVGKPVRLDTATQTKSYLGFARVMVEVSMGQDFPDIIEFMDEKDVLHRQIVHYEWKPVKCTECSGMGHVAMVCRKKKEVVQAKGKQKMVWRPKPVIPPPVPSAPSAPVEDHQEQQLPTIDPTAIVTPMPVNGHILNTITPARILTRLLRPGPDRVPGEGRSFMDKMILSLGRSNETRVKTNNINKVKSGLGLNWQLIHNNDIKEGGRIWLLWNNSVYDVELLLKEEQLIHVKVTFIPKDFFWELTVVYGFNKLQERSDLWHTLTSLGNGMSNPWIVMGDFNNVLFMDERIGSTITTAEVRGFQDCVDNCGLMDLASSGAFFTWNNKQEGEARVYSRIDRIMANDIWVLHGPEGSLSFLPEGLYDHSPCVMDLWKDNPKVKARFHYFNMWGKCEEFLVVVKKFWEVPIQGFTMFQLVKKLKLLKQPLKQMNKEYYRHIETTAHVAELLLHDLQRRVHANPFDLRFSEERQSAKTFL
ncbi:uncharacterized protein LOC141607254 [Silene latifolia]|uniref:uncharacterized protein LOC141607254 n=1 Tax=Silene latifolia TaxID=37657 RepID=UPI003D778A89